MSSAGAGGFRLSYDEGQLIGFKEYVNELRVMGVVLQQQNPKTRRNHFRVANKPS
jgi:hypothetical protein